MFKKLFSIIVFSILAISLNANVIASSLETMSLRQKIGQMLCLDLRYLDDGKPIKDLTDEKQASLARELVKKYNIGLLR